MIATKLENHGMYTMGDVAKESVYDEDSLYKLFGVNAELLIDHAWGWEPCTIESVKAYKPTTNGASSGQVLHCPYGYEKTKLYTSSTKVITEAVTKLYNEIINKNLLVRRINITANKLIKETDVKDENFTQMNFFVNQNEIDKSREKEKSEKRIQKAMLQIKDKYGKNAIIKGMNLEEGGTTIERNKQIGGHKE